MQRSVEYPLQFSGCGWPSHIHVLFPSRLYLFTVVVFPAGILSIIMKAYWLYAVSTHASLSCVTVFHLIIGKCKKTLGSFAFFVCVFCAFFVLFLFFFFFAFPHALSVAGLRVPLRFPYAPPPLLSGFPFASLPPQIQSPGIHS